MKILLSLGITSSAHLGAAIAGGTSKLVRHVADGLGRALDFDSMLHGDLDPDATPDTAVDPEALRQTAIERIESSLATIGIEPNQPLVLDVNAAGDVRMAIDHRRAAEIELHLLADPQVREAVRQLAAAVGPTPLTISPAPDEPFGPA